MKASVFYDTSIVYYCLGDFEKGEWLSFYYRKSLKMDFCSLTFKCLPLSVSILRLGEMFTLPNMVSWFDMNAKEFDFFIILINSCAFWCSLSFNWFYSSWDLSCEVFASFINFAFVILSSSGFRLLNCTTSNTLESYFDMTPPSFFSSCEPLFFKVAKTDAELLIFRRGVLIAKYYF